MAEALAAVGLAANVLQFIEIGCKFTSRACRIYRFGVENAEEVIDLQGITHDLQNVLEHLETSQFDAGSIAEDESGFVQLIKKCQSVAHDLLACLRKIDLPRKGRKRDAIKVSFQLMWKEEDLTTLQKRLDSFRQELTIHLLGLIRRQGQHSLAKQEEILTTIKAVRKDVGLDDAFTNGIGTLLLKTLSALKNNSKSSEEERCLQADLTTDIDHHISRDYSKIEAQPLISEKRRESLYAKFLDQLCYDGMQDREERIAEAHENTFKWIFTLEDKTVNRWSNFRDWLESGTQLYWITGKAGSGKSTLMKYICQIDGDMLIELHESTEIGSDLTLLDSNSRTATPETRCTRHLRKWAGSAQLIVAKFFFWNSGARFQMTQKGLLRSLLHQILRAAPNLIPKVTPTRWEMLCLFNETSRGMSMSELHDALYAIAKEASESMKLCIFVDGLDEFEGPYDNLIQLFKALVSNPHVKACVSSRPWIVFEDAFQHKPSLMLQDLTYSDIKYYVTTSLQSDPGFAQLRRSEQQYADQLIEDVVSKASGVFLWVTLVVASLLAGMGNRDRVIDLQRRLDLLPPALEDLYDKLLRSLDPFYLEHAAQFFKYVEESLDPPPLLLLSIADDEDLDVVLNRNVVPLTQDDVSFREDTMRRRLNSRCKGFLEVGSSSDYSKETGPTVQYLHRTVKDYVEGPKAQKTLGAALDPTFDVYYKLCVSGLGYLKVLSDDENVLTHDTFWAGIHRCLYSAARTKATSRENLIPLLDDLDKTGAILGKRLSRYMAALEAEEHNQLVGLLDKGHWTVSKTELGQKLVNSSTYLSLIVRCGIVEYIKARAHHGCLVQDHQGRIWPLLLDTIPLESELREPSTTPQLDMVACLLEKGADPNYRFQSNGLLHISIWHQVIQQIAKSHTDLYIIKPPWDEIAHMMMQHGAKLDQKEIYRELHMSTIYRPPGKGPNSQTVGEAKPFSLYLSFVIQEILAMKESKSSSWTSWLSWSKKRTPYR